MRFAVFAEVNMNIVDGSSVWLQSVCRMLASEEAVAVELLLRVPEQRDLLTTPLHDHPQIRVVDPTPWLGGTTVLTPERALEALAALDAEGRLRGIILRGAETIGTALADGRFIGRLWPYHIPPHGAVEDDAYREHIRLMARDSAGVLCQTEEIAGHLRDIAPEHGRKLILLPPMVPPLPELAPRALDRRRLRLLYSGKLSPEYYCLEMFELLRTVRRRLPGTELHVLGDKVHNPPDDPGFKLAVERGLSGTDGLRWHGGVPRDEVFERMQEIDIALSLRHPSLDASKEISTKVLEYGSAGLPVLLNRTAVYERLLGPDYPLFAGDLEEAAELLTAVPDRPEAVGEAANRCREASRRFTFERVMEGLRPHLFGSGRAPSRQGTARLLLAGHDFKFLGAIPEQAVAAGAALREDRWRRHDVHDPGQSLAAVEWADTILCEWCLGNARWYSRHVRDDQRLVIRLHRMELDTPFPGEVNLEKVDRMVFVADHVRKMAIERFGWAEPLPAVVIPNAIDTAAFDLPKLEDSEFNLGLVGFVPALKRPDLALDLLELLRARDPRFRLLLKGRPPWELEWVARRSDERAYYENLLERIETSTLLRHAVVFEPFGDDLARFFQKVRFVLSLSDIEGHAVALAEGMASQAVPVVLDRPGAREQYDRTWVHASIDDAAAGVLRLASTRTTGDEGNRAQAMAQAWDSDALRPAWEEALGLNPGVGASVRLSADRSGS